MDKDSFEIVVWIIVFLMVIIGFLIQSSRLEDPNDHTVIFTNQLLNLVKLRKTFSCIAYIYRQSGSLYSDPIRYSSVDVALKEVLKTMNRAKIDSFHIIENTESLLKVNRAFKNYRGKDGRKVGGFTIEID